MIAGKGRLVSQISVGGMPKDLILVDGNTFREVFTLNRPYIFHGEYTAAADENDYSNSRNFLTSDGLAGLSISPDGWLASFFSNLPERGFMNAVGGIIRAEVRKLVCIASEDRALVYMYMQLGFSVCAETLDDRGLMRKYHGKRFVEDYSLYHKVLYHVFMINDAFYREDKFQLFNNYFKALEYVESL